MVVRAIVVWLVAAGGYLFLAGDVGTVELVAGAVCATVAVTLALALCAVTDRPFRLRPPPRAVLAPLKGLLVEPFVVGAALVRAVATGAAPGKLQAQPFEPGGDDPIDAGRRAVAVIGLSLAPRSFAVRQDDDGLIVHSLPAKPRVRRYAMAGMMIWLVATLALVPALAVPVLVALRGLANQRLAAVQLAGPIAAFMLAALTFATDQSSFIDIALCLALLSIVGTFLMALFMERWL